MIRGFNAATTAIDHAPLNGSPGVTTGVTELGSVGDLQVGVWEHSVGNSTDVEVDEVFIVLRGRGSVTCTDGGRIDLAPGVVGILPTGAHTRWEITEPLLKVWVTAAGFDAP